MCFEFIVLAYIQKALFYRMQFLGKTCHNEELAPSLNSISYTVDLPTKKAIGTKYLNLSLRAFFFHVYSIILYIYLHSDGVFDNCEIQ